MLTRRTLLLSALAAPFVSPASAANDNTLKMRELYGMGHGFSDLAYQLDGNRITVEGYMAPPLKADSQFFVLTRIPMSVCPFCETEAEWPDDIMAIYTKRVIDVVPFNVKIKTSGLLEMGSYKDPDTGFLSLIRLTDATYDR
ncbi:hypothetical protein [Pseudoruegeria sp. HB172150]|uniref:hypothetical protein n=1 Tax=Pseudoruegeria sp. HB172150 TaxID=2721164 RepID=UPI0015519931|nr:hypothetical protein [Pseudoruegeria sp. HB172150]